MWYHYKEGKVIGITKFESLPKACQEWWEQCQSSKSQKSMRFKILKKEDLIFIDSAIHDSGDSFDEYDSCRMPHCLGFCDLRVNLESKQFINSRAYEKAVWKWYGEFTEKHGKEESWTDDIHEIFKKEKPPQWEETEEYEELLKEYLADIRKNCKPENYEEYIIYKEMS